MLVAIHAPSGPRPAINSPSPRLPAFHRSAGRRLMMMRAPDGIHSKSIGLPCVGRPNSGSPDFSAAATWSVSDGSSGTACLCGLAFFAATTSGSARAGANVFQPQTPATPRITTPASIAIFWGRLRLRRLRRKRFNEPTSGAPNDRGVDSGSGVSGTHCAPVPTFGPELSRCERGAGASTSSISTSSGSRSTKRCSHLGHLPVLPSKLESRSFNTALHLGHGIEIVMPEVSAENSPGKPASQRRVALSSTNADKTLCLSYA